MIADLLVKVIIITSIYIFFFCIEIGLRVIIPWIKDSLTYRLLIKVYEGFFLFYNGKHYKILREINKRHNRLKYENKYIIKQLEKNPKIKYLMELRTESIKYVYKNIRFDIDIYMNRKYAIKYDTNIQISMITGLI